MYIRIYTFSSFSILHQNVILHFNSIHIAEKAENKKVASNNALNIIILFSLLFNNSKAEIDMKRK